MSGTMRKMGVYLGLLEGAEDEFGYDDEPRREPVERAERGGHPTPRDGGRARPVVADAEDTTTTRRPDVPPQRGEVAHLADRRRTAAPAAAPTAAPVTASSAMSRIVTLHPRTYNEAKVIGENFRDGIPVIMNLSEMTDADAKRLVDFAAGLIFSVRGSIERVTSKVFLLSPPNVFVAAEDKQRIAEGGFFNQS
ncbi:cell division protein SepF 2 [Marmoricola endophyticus]|uniref:Cell division protein SepF n=1 Tax=Marmoricola endophyticus TaxID=2040280 RepID=A0A917BD97_9ACTN|nr:cell division protein SepF [Marmoricola endophyticus]GGF37892.1 cell division protein SepF 2 [Marmoricola endophyticus]